MSLGRQILLKQETKSANIKQICTLVNIEAKHLYSSKDIIKRIKGRLQEEKVFCNTQKKNRRLTAIKVKNYY